MRRILHEEELATLAEENKKLEIGDGRLSERHLKAEIEKRRKALEELAEEDDWMFDCSGCGVHGANLVSSDFWFRFKPDRTADMTTSGRWIWDHLLREMQRLATSCLPRTQQGGR